MTYPVTPQQLVSLLNSFPDAAQQIVARDSAARTAGFFGPDIVVEMLAYAPARLERVGFEVFPCAPGARCRR